MFATEQFSYDATGNVYDAKGRSYGRGNRLERAGNIEYVWDKNGCLVEKRVQDPVKGLQVWHYKWGGLCRLMGVTTPDGKRIEFGYDPFARRITKSVYPDAKAAAPSAFCRYVWEKDKIVHEIREQADASGDPITSETTFYYDEEFGHPLAQRLDTVVDGVRTTGNWRFFVNDVLGTPERLIDEGGQLVGELDRRAFGSTTTVRGETTSLRFDGQFADEETGLHYNRYRYYDPDLGRFISEDPDGAALETNAYRYCVNPINHIDPYGLVHTATAVFTPKGGTATELNKGKPYYSNYDSEHDDYSRNYNKENGLHPMQNFACKDKDGVLMHRTSDTEAQILRDLKAMKKAGTILEGGHLEISGQLPPCSACHRKMMSFAKKHGCTIKYNYNGGSSSYP